MKKTKILIIISITITSILLLYNKQSINRFETSFYPMGGIPFKIIIYDKDKNKFNNNINLVKKKVKKLEDIFNPYLDTSELSKVNIEAYQKPVKIEDNLLRIINLSKIWWNKTDHAFDITVMPLIKLWKQASINQTIPSKNQIDQILNAVGFNNILIKDNLISFTNALTKIDLGGIAKGEIVDQVANLLKKRDVNKAIIDAGGDILAFGNSSFNFGIQDPLDKNSLLAKITIKNKAIVTSGNYERFLSINGQKFSHIIDPKTGWPVANTLISATVITSNCAEADLIATALMVMGKEKSIDFLNKNKNFYGILVEKNDDFVVWISNDLKPDIELKEYWQNKVQYY